MKTAACTLALALSAPLALADVDRERRLGDQLSLALPLGTAAVELWRGDREGAWQLAQVFVLTTGTTELLKRATDVQRPDRSDTKSFPSGHAARAFSAAAYVQQRHGWQAAWPLWLGATYVGHTRVQADRHRWADVAGAAALAWGMARWRVERAGPDAAKALAWLGPAEQGGWQLGLQMQF